jgi:hypothetical protein
LSEAISAVLHQAGFLVRPPGTGQAAAMLRPLILMLLDPGQHLTETLVLDDGRVADALQSDGDRP